ncbi:mechanosensitive ion channel [bacterium]|nr:mechanosensitive ion channel [bacterium]
MQDIFSTLHLDDPVILRGILSGVTLALTLVCFIVIRKIFSRFDLANERVNLTRRLVKSFIIFIASVLMLRIWAWSYLYSHFNQDFMNKLLTSLLGFVLFALFIYFSRLLIKAQRLASQKEQQYIRWATWGILGLFILILLRVWAFTDRFEILRDPMMKKLYASLFILAIIYVILFFVRRIINAMHISLELRHEYRKRTTYAGGVIYILLLIPIWAVSGSQWTTIISVMGAGVALALHEVLLNLAGWMYILVRRPYKTGDRIELGNVRGDVIDIRLFQTSLLEIGNWVDGDQSTGRLVHMPHGQIFRNPLFNYTKGFEYIWHEISILVTYESNWEAAEKILLECGETQSKAIQDQVKKKIAHMAREYLIYYRTFTPYVYIKTEESGVQLTLRYLTEAKKRRSGQDIISREIVKRISAAKDVDFAYPTVRIYKAGEGK